YIPLHLHRTTHPTHQTSPLSLHDALPISVDAIRFSKANQKLALPAGDIDHARTCGQPKKIDKARQLLLAHGIANDMLTVGDVVEDRKSTRLNSSHVKNSYAVFCLKKKNLV